MKIWNLAAVALAAAMMLVGPAHAVSTGPVPVPAANQSPPTCNWVLASSTPGPLRLQNKSTFPVAYAISDTTPSGSGPFFSLEQNAPDKFTDVYAPSTSFVYLCNYGSSTTNIIVSPIEIGGTFTGSFTIGGVTIADGADATQGAKADAAYTGSGSASEIAILKGIYAQGATPIPPGSNTIGNIGNTAFGISGSLPAGSNNIGTIGNTGFGVTQGGNTAAVIPGSTSPSASAAALNVTISPNSAALIQTGSAGSSSPEVLSFQGIAGGTPAPVVIANGADTAQGSTTDSAYTGSGSSTMIAALKGIYALGSTPLPGQSGHNVNIGAVEPLSSGIQSAKIDVSTATTTELVALSGSTKIYVTSFDIVSGGAGTAKFVHGTGSNCGTSTTDLTGAYPLAAQAGIAKGSGFGVILVIPAGKALCIVTTGGVQMSGSISYMQF